MSAIGVGVVFLASSFNCTSCIVFDAEMIGSRRSLSNDGKRGESVRSSTRGGAALIEETVVSVLPRRIGGFAPNNRVRLGFEGSRGDRFGFSGGAGASVGSRTGMDVSPKQKSSSPLGGVLNNSSRRSIKTVKTFPGILSEGPRDSMSDFIVIRFVSVCLAMRESRETMLARPWSALT